MGSLKAALTFAIALLLVGWLSSACQSIPRSRTFGCQVAAGNRAPKDLLFVVIDPDEFPIQFGYLGPGYPTVQKGAGGQRVRLIKALPITWVEAGIVKRAYINMEPYLQQRSRIRSFEFWYQGDDQWDVIARDSIGLHANSIRP